MKHSEREVSTLYQEDFSQPFIGTFSAAGSDIDVLTVVHPAISYHDAEKDKNVFEILPGLFMSLVPYDFLKDMKLRSSREKDLWDISQPENLRTRNN